MEISTQPIQQQEQTLDLHLFLFDRPLHPELFHHFNNYRVTQGNYVVDLWVVGLSHAITLTSNQRSMTELVSRENDALPNRGVLSRFKLKGERDHERRSPEGWLYLVSSQVETMDEALYKSVHFDLLRHGNRKGWLTTYDQWTDNEMVPFTYIDTEARDREFHVHTFHAFPQERTIVKTQSLFELP